MEILKGIVDNVHPKLIIVIDALASRSIERISSTVQIADTGIVPGAGVGKSKKGIDCGYIRNTSNSNRGSNSCRSSKPLQQIALIYLFKDYKKKHIPNEF